jgi:hypothetical protein
MPQTAAWSIRPPSSGNPGSTLKIAIAMLMRATTSMISATGSAGAAPPTSAAGSTIPATTQSTAPITRLVTGPRAEIANAGPAPFCSARAAV